MALQGNEILLVQGVQPNGQPSGQQFQTTTGAIAELSATESTFVSTPITTVGNGTLTAAGIVGGQINRSGPTAAFTDTTDTATAIATAAGGVVGSSFFARLKNGCAFPQTIAAGTGVTLPATVLVPAWSVGVYAVTINSATTCTFTHIVTEPIAISQSVTLPALTALSTVGAGTILAASFASGYVARSGSQSGAAFTDTTDTAANIIAACANLANKVGTATVFTYENTTNAPATITGGTGVTVSGVTIVPPNASATFVVTQTAAATLTMVGCQAGYLPNSGTFTANGASQVTVANANVTAFSNIIFTLKTVGGTVGAYPAIKTITPGTGLNVACTASDTSIYNYVILG